MSGKENRLRASWVAWEQYDTKGNDYADEMAEIVGFASVESFWRFFENFPKMSDILFDGMTKKALKRIKDGRMSEPKIIRAVSIFKHGVRPEWEATGNVGGGFFALKRLNNLRQLDALYEALSMAVVGGSGDPHNVVNGIRVVDKSANGMLSPGLMLSGQQVRDRTLTGLVVCKLTYCRSMQVQVRDLDWRMQYSHP